MADQLTGDQISELRQVFSDLDADGDGRIGFETAMRYLDQYPMKLKLELVDEVDPQIDRTTNLREFLELMASKMKHTDLKEEFKEADRLHKATLIGLSGSNEMGMIDPTNNQMPRWSSPVYGHTQVFGLEGDTRKMKAWLYTEDKGISVVGVVGMGGLGKTTLAQKVFNERDIVDRFEIRMWVTVSKSLDEEQIMKSMLRNLAEASVVDDPGEMLKKINQHLLKKRFLIVLDDIWSLDVNWFHTIYDGLPKGNGSRIIITTRIEEVARKMGVNEARIHRPKFLSTDESWLLFQKIAFAETGGECRHDDMEKIGKEIVSKCKGLPLAIKAIGGTLLYKSHYHEWKKLANNYLDVLARNDVSVMASSQLSYDNLPQYRKSRFPSFPCTLHKLMEELRRASKAFNSESVQVRAGVVASQLEGRRAIYNRRTIKTPNVPDDGYSWKRYDKKEIPNARYPRNCFRCPHKFTQGCLANRWVQRIESDTVLFKVTYIGKHTCKQLPQKEGTELLALSISFVSECLSLIFEQLNHPLLGTVMGSVAFTICVAEFLFKAWTEQVTLRWKGKMPLLYSRNPIYKPFGSIIQWFGLVAASRVVMPQLLHYARNTEENAFKILIALAVLCICFVVPKIVFSTDHP